MKTLLIGATGLLGTAMAAEIRLKRWPLVTAARHGADRTLDVADLDALQALLDEEAPELVVNASGVVDIGQCEADPELAHNINARPLLLLAEWSQRTGGRLLHVSTDHYFAEGGSTPHREDEPVVLLNEYARSKYAGEAFALAAPGALVLRTSIVGVRRWERPTFAEWAIATVLGNEPVILFDDAWTSSIDVAAFARAALDLVEAGGSGLLNLAAGEVYSKADFVREIASQLDRPLDHATIGSVTALRPPRPASLGLDVGKAQALLDRPLPGLSDVVRSVLSDYGEGTGR